MRLLDLFCGRWGWSRAFAARGWRCLGVDLTQPPEIPDRCEFWKADVLTLTCKKNWFSLRRQDEVGHVELVRSISVSCEDFDFIVASPPCEEFSVHGMKHFHPNPKYPENGIRLFNHTRQLCEASGLPYVIENVRAAQQFVGKATCNAGAFHLWHNLGNFKPSFGYPFKLPARVVKGATQMRRDGRYKRAGGVDEQMYRAKDIRAANLATIPLELASSVADYAERLLEQRKRA